VLSLHRLRLLREVHLRGTLAAAAAALGYNPSSVSHQLTTLEGEVGTRLLEPVGRSVRLTAAALVLVAHTEQILRRLEEAEAEVAAMRAGAVRGVVRVATFQTVAHAVLPRVVRALAARHPRLRLRVTHVPAEKALPALLARDVDLVLVEEYPGHPEIRLDGVTIDPIGQDPIRLLSPVADPLPALAAAADRPWVLEPAGTPARRWATATCRAAGFDPAPAYESADLLLHVRLVAEAGAVALVPGLALGATVDARVTALPAGPTRTIATAVRRGAGGAPAVAAVRTALKAALDQALTR
jgi:DNA-binding transcriptional LysR family regulator